MAGRALGYRRHGQGDADQQHVHVVGGLAKISCEEDRSDDNDRDDHNGQTKSPTDPRHFAL